jgi:lipase chaperone LimK
VSTRYGPLVIAAGALAALSLVAFMGRSTPPAAPAMPGGAPAAAVPFAPSLQGTRPDGGVHVAPDDSVAVDEQLIALFDYYLSTVGEHAPDQVRAQIERELDRSLRPAAAAAAKRALLRYLGYKQALAALEAGPGLAGPDAASLQRRLAALASLRARFFSRQEIAAIFGREDAANADALARLRIREDRSLTPQQKEERLAALDASLPPALRESREAPLRIGRMQEAAERMRAAGADDAAVFRMRAEAFGADAAGRLAEVDREEAAWKQRIAAYLAQRRSLNDEAALAVLRNRMFSEEEQRRLPVYEAGQM